MWTSICNFLNVKIFHKPEIITRPCVNICSKCVHGKRMKLTEQQKDVYSTMGDVQSSERIPPRQENFSGDEEECRVIAEIPRRKLPEKSSRQSVNLCAPNNVSSTGSENADQSLMIISSKQSTSRDKLTKCESRKFFNTPRASLRPSKEIKSRLLYRSILKRNVNFFQESYRLTEKLQYIHLVQSQITQFVMPSKPAKLQIKAKEDTIPIIDLTEENTENRLVLRTSGSSDEDDVQIVQEVPKVRSLKDMLKIKPVNPEDAMKEILSKNPSNKLDFREIQSFVHDTINISDEEDDDCLIDDKSLTSNPEGLEEKLRTLMQITGSVSPKVDNNLKEKYTLPKLTSQQETIVHEALKSGPSSEVLSECFGLKITKRDMQTLKGLNWLNDEVINFYMNLIVERSKVNNSLPKVYAFNTFFYPKLASSGYISLKRWTKQVDIFSYDMILIPIHLGMHWCMSVIDFRCKAIKYFDSIGSPNNVCLTTLLHYLKEESFDKKKELLFTYDWEKMNVQDIPQQMNGSDCGVFSCVFAEHLARDCGFYFTQNDMPYFRKKMVVEILEKRLLT